MPTAAVPLLGPADALRVVIGEIYDPRRAVEVEHPTWLSMPDRGLFTGIAIFGAIGSGKTTCCMRPLYRADSLLRRERSVLQDGGERQNQSGRANRTSCVLDLDGGGREAVDRIIQAPGIPPPHHILNTSPGKHQLIRSVTGFEKDQAEHLVRGMAARHGADQAVWDVARILRVPGFRNHNHEATRHFVEDVQDQPPLVRDYGPRGANSRNRFKWTGAVPAG